MKNKKITTLQVAGTYIGTIVGAGFASGQEMLQFFVSFGKIGLVGLLIVTLLFIYFGYIIMELGWKLKVSSHLPIVKKVGGKYLSVFSDVVITFFLFGALTAMIAGSGALFHQEFNLNPHLGSLFMATITVITVLGGFDSIINSISIVVPFLILSAVTVSIAAILSAPSLSDATLCCIERPILLRNWLWSSILYISYNIVPSISILGPLGKQAQDRKTIRNGAILGGVGLGVGAIAIFLALYVNASSIEHLEIPMIMVARRISRWFKAYMQWFCSEIYTTAVEIYTAFRQEYVIEYKEGYYRCLAMFLLGVFSKLHGFSNLVKYMYPTVDIAVY